MSCSVGQCKVSHVVSYSYSCRVIFFVHCGFLCTTFEYEKMEWIVVKFWVMRFLLFCIEITWSTFMLGRFLRRFGLCCFQDQLCVLVDIVDFWDFTGVVFVCLGFSVLWWEIMPNVVCSISIYSQNPYTTLILNKCIISARNLNAEKKIIIVGMCQTYLHC